MDRCFSPARMMSPLPIRPPHNQMISLSRGSCIVWCCCFCSSAWLQVSLTGHASYRFGVLKDKASSKLASMWRGRNTLVQYNDMLLSCSKNKVSSLISMSPRCGSPVLSTFGKFDSEVGESEPFVSVVLSNLPTTIADLEPHQIHSFYELVGQMIQAESDNTKRDEYLKRLMSLPNQKWAEKIGEAGRNADILKNQDVIRSVLNILQTNTSVACSLGPYFLPQISVIFLDMLTVCRMYSELVSNTICEGGPFASKTSFVKLLRSVKRETLKLIETFLDKAEDLPHLGKQFVPPMMDPVLG